MPSALATSALLDQLIATQTYDNYLPGTDITITIQIDYSGSLSAVGFGVNLPTGWSFVSANGTDTPGILPTVGQTETLNFSWITPPVSPIEFTYTVNVPAGAVGSP